MHVPFIDLPEQARRLGPALDEAVQAVLASQQCILGPVVERFEQSMAEYVGVRHAIGVGSGTDALTLTLASLGVGPGTRVITTPFSFFATASCIARLGARPVFVDVEPDTLNLDLRGVARVLETDATDIVGVLPVHLFGRLVDMPALEALATRHGIWIVEDAAQAAGARGARRGAGGLGRAGCLSFYPTKNLGGIGDGGMVLTNDDALAADVRRDRNQGMTEAYRHETLGACSRLSAVNAAALATKLPHLDAWNARRRAIATSYGEALRAAGLARSPGSPDGPLRLPQPHGDAHVFHQYVLRTRARDALAAHLRAAGIATQIYYPVALHRQPALAGLADVPFGAAEAERATRDVLALPIYPELGDEQVAYVIDALCAFFRGT